MYMLLLVLMICTISFGFPRQTSSPGVKSPCPGLNALANAGFLPKDGLNTTFDQIVDVSLTALSMDPGILGAFRSGLSFLFQGPGGTMASFADLNLTHNHVEHDASLSRSDEYIGNYVLSNKVCARSPFLRFNVRIDVGESIRSRMVQCHVPDERFC